MPRFSTHFELNNSQAELDFVDVKLDRDVPLYLDPYAIQIKQDDWSLRSIGKIRSFFGELLDALRANNIERATHLLSNLHEPNETRLGVSIGEPKGRAIGPKKGRMLAEALQRSRAFETGLLADIAEAELFVKYIGPDTISDLVTNVLRQDLADYTSEQCNIYGVDLHPCHTLGPVWNPQIKDWESKVQRLPYYEGKPILLVPKFSVRRSLALNSQEFWNFHMTEYLQHEYLNAGGALVQSFKDGTKYVTKKSVQEIHPMVKDELAAFVREHPEVLEAYKKIKGAEGPLDNSDFSWLIEEELFDESAFAEVLIDRLESIPTGPHSANEYHTVIMGICTFLFYPRLSCPIKEHEIHDGRKRIDIKYTNTATRGFFFRMLENPNTRSIDIPMECKNYTADLGNDALDQLSGRFSVHRGRFGILLCRALNDRNLFVQRCRDTVGDDRGYIVLLEDQDIIQMLDFIRGNNRGLIDQHLQNKFDEII